VVTNSAPIAAAVGRHYATVTRPSRSVQAIDALETLLMLIFIRPWAYWIPAALPFLGLGRTVYPERITVRRLSGFQAGLLRQWRQQLARSNAARTDAVSYFASKLAGHEQRGVARPYLRYPIVAPDAQTRQRVCRLAEERGLGIAAAYPTPINDIPEIAAAFAAQRFPSATQLSQRLLTLPTHHWLSERDRRAIVALCREAVAA
jgi:perosamine synthetase